METYLYILVFVLIASIITLAIKLRNKINQLEITHWRLQESVNSSKYWLNLYRNYYDKYMDLLTKTKNNHTDLQIGDRVTMKNNCGDYVINNIEGNQAEIITNTTRQKVHVDTLQIYKPNKVS